MRSTQWSELLPYDGARTREHLGGRAEAGQPSERTTYGADRSGTVTYRFSSLGFRSPELDPSAARHVFVCGASSAFGTGIAAERSWVDLVVGHYRAHLGMEAHDVNLVNFSEGGAGNGYVVRTLLAQCARVEPDLVIAELVPGHSRAEYLSHEVLGTDRHVNLGPWLFDREGNVSAKVLREHPELAEVVAAYYDWWSDEVGVLATVKDVLLLQGFCQGRSIPYVVCWGHGPGMASSVEPWRQHPSIGPLLDLVDWSRVFGRATHDERIDFAADGVHAGPAACEQYAAGLWSHLAAPGQL